MANEIFSLPWAEKGEMTDERIHSLRRALEETCYEAAGDVFEFLCTAPEKEWIKNHVNACVSDMTNDTGYLRRLIIAKTAAIMDKYLESLSEDPD